MLFRRSSKTADEELGTAEENTPLCGSLDQYKILKVDPINNHDFQTEDVQLLDISSNKEWMAYISFDQNRDSSENRIPKTYLTRRRFTSVDVYSGQKIILKDGYQNLSTEDGHFSIDITSCIKPTKSEYCRFLSISHNGLYIALSFYEIHNNPNSIDNNKCFIFQVYNNSIKLISLPECVGRAVFLNEKKITLAFIDVKTLTYASFLPGASDKTTFDLDIFEPGVTPASNLSHRSYIKNSPWLNVEGEDEGIKKLITLTRHIKQNIITTPFQLGIVRTWSIKENGVRLTSFEANEDHIMAFSKDCKFTAAYDESNQSIHVYNVKSGLLVYRLKSQKNDLAINFEVSHIRFCYGGRYVAMSGWESNKVVFEIWYLEAEKSIYRESRNVGERCFKSKQLKVFEPFVTRGYNTSGEKCLMGFYMYNNADELETKCMELRIDNVEYSTGIEWIKDGSPDSDAEYEISNNLLDFRHLKCGYIHIGEMEYLIRFGKHTIQLWRVNSNATKEDMICDEDELLYIRAYKAPNYGLAYSFRDNWKICNFNSIKFVGAIPLGRLIVNIRDTSNDNTSSENNSKAYHTEEVFLPLDETVRGKKIDYHHLESACQALHYLFLRDKHETVVHGNMAKLQSKTLNLVKSAISNIHKDYNYFSTISGSKTLAMLASFKEGREMIESLLIKDVPISIFSFHVHSDKIEDKRPPALDNAIKHWKACFSKIKLKISRKTKNNASTEITDTHYESTEAIKNYYESTEVIENDDAFNDILNKKITYRSSREESILSDICKNLATNENVLTVLIEESSYDLFKLLFNRILSNSKKLGPGCLSALTDALVFLQEEENFDLLLLSSQKLSYLKIDFNKLGILKSEVEKHIKITSPVKEYVDNLKNLESHSIKEQLTRYSHFEFYIWKYIRRLCLEYNSVIYIRTLNKFLREIVDIIEYFVQGPVKKQKELSNLCVIPLPHFSSYSDFPEDRIKIGETSEDIIPYKKESAFTRIASNQSSNNIFRQGDTILEVLLEHKWKMFARNKFILICFIHSLYYVSYSTGVLFSRILYVKGDNNEFDMGHPGHIASLSVMGVSLSVLVFKEIHQFFISRSKIAYLKSGYNWVDIAAFVFPVLTVLQSFLGWNYFNEVCSITTLILWLHGILRLRVISYFGVTLEIIIVLFRNVFSVLFIMLLVIIAFTQAFIVLLNTQEDVYFQDKFSGNFISNTTLTAGNITTEGLANSANVSADNGFVNWFKAFSQVWFFVYGVWDPVNGGEAGDSKTLMALCILFSFITVLIFFNMVIALMSSTVEDVKKQGKKVWVSHFAAVVSEIELLWCTKGEKRSRINNPIYIYYVANSETISAQEKKLEKETAQLLEELRITPKKY